MLPDHDGNRFPLSDGFAMLSRESDHLRVEEHGNPATAAECTRYFAAIERALVTAGCKLALIVAQRTGANPASPHWKEVRDARWRALATTGADRIAVVVEDDLGVARVQMAAVAARAPVRAFLRESDAVEWLRSST
ncbi:MAG: hypothetical protein ABI175_04430 [Polyangiales bacterium]